MNWLTLTQLFWNTCGTFELKALFNAASSLDIWFHWVRSGILVPIYETIDPAVLTSNDAPPRPIFHPRSSENFMSSPASFIFSSRGWSKYFPTTMYESRYPRGAQASFRPRHRHGGQDKNIKNKNKNKNRLNWKIFCLRGQVQKGLSWGDLWARLSNDVEQKTLRGVVLVAVSEGWVAMLISGGVFKILAFDLSFCVNVR